MKKIILTLWVCVLLSACATMKSENWVGQNFDSFVIKYGVPSAQYTMQNGSTSYSFKKPCAATQAQEEVTVIVGKDNIVQSTVVQSRCPSAYEVKQYK